MRKPILGYPLRRDLGTQFATCSLNIEEDLWKSLNLNALAKSCTSHRGGLSSRLSQLLGIRTLTKSLRQRKSPDFHVSISPHLTYLSSFIIRKFKMGDHHRNIMTNEEADKVQVPDLENLLKLDGYLRNHEREIRRRSVPPFSRFHRLLPLSLQIWMFQSHTKRHRRQRRRIG